jgi:hypothetical protein
MEKDYRSEPNWRALPKWLGRTWQRLLGFWNTEGQPSVASDYECRVRTYPESKAFVALAWLQSTVAVLHVVFGPLAFSSMMFIGTIDATTIVSRFFVSTLMCRVVIRYELAGLRETCVEVMREDYDLRHDVETPFVERIQQVEDGKGTELRETNKKTSQVEVGQGSSEDRSSYSGR